MNESNKAPEFSAPAEAAKMTVNQQHLKQAWDTSQVSTREDWLGWMHRLSVEFMKESPSHALRACMSLVDVHPPAGGIFMNNTRYVVIYGSGGATPNKMTGRSCSRDRLCYHVANSTIRADTPVVELVRVHGTRRPASPDREQHPRGVCPQVPCLRQGTALQGT